MGLMTMMRLGAGIRREAGDTRVLALRVPAVCLAFFAGWFALAERSGLGGPLYVRGAVNFLGALAFSLAALALVSRLSSRGVRRALVILVIVSGGARVAGQVVGTSLALLLGYGAGVMLLAVIAYVLCVAALPWGRGFWPTVIAAGLLGTLCFVASYDALRQGRLAFFVVELALMTLAVLAVTRLTSARPTPESRSGVPAVVDARGGRVAALIEMGGLTPREGDVLALLVRGYSLPVACARLGIAPGTGDTHLKRIYRKLGVHSREELIDLAADGPAPHATGC